MNEDNTWKKFENNKDYEVGVAEFVGHWAETRNNDKAKVNIEKRKLLFDAVITYSQKTFCWT